MKDDPAVRRELRNRAAIRMWLAVVVIVLVGFCYLWATGQREWLPLAALMPSAFIIPQVGFLGFLWLDITFNKRDKKDQ